MILSHKILFLQVLVVLCSIMSSKASGCLTAFQTCLGHQPMIPCSDVSRSEQRLYFNYCSTRISWNQDRSSIITISDTIQMYEKLCMYLCMRCSGPTLKLVLQIASVFLPTRGYDVPANHFQLFRCGLYTRLKAQQFHDFEIQIGNKTFSKFHPSLRELQKVLSFPYNGKRASTHQLYKNILSGNGAIVWYKKIQ